MLNRFSLTAPIASIAALGLVTLTGTIARAAIITYDFQVEIDSGPLDTNIYTGFFSYDDTPLTGIGSESIASLNSFSFTFDGNTYGLGSNPVVLLSNGTFLGLDFSIGVPTPPPYPLITFAYNTIDPIGPDFLYDLGAPGQGTGIPTYTLRSAPPSTPEPAAALSLLLCGAWGIASRYRRSDRE